VLLPELLCGWFGGVPDPPLLLIKTIAAMTPITPTAARAPRMRIVSKHLQENFP
jgi:hypothetical protein